MKTTKVNLKLIENDNELIDIIEKRYGGIYVTEDGEHVFLGNTELYPFLNPTTGYKQLKVWVSFNDPHKHGKGGIYKNYYVHRLVAAAFIEKPAGKTFVDHINSDRTNNHASNLRWCTRKENNSTKHSSKMKSINSKHGWKHKDEYLVITKGNEFYIAESKAVAAKLIGCTSQNITRCQNNNWKPNGYKIEYINKYEITPDERNGVLVFSNDGSIITYKQRKQINLESELEEVENAIKANEYLKGVLYERYLNRKNQILKQLDEMETK